MTDKITEQKPIFAVMTTSDLTEGRAANFPLCFCWSKTTARRLGDGKYVQGSDCPIKEHTAYRINGLWHVPPKIVDPTKEDIELDERVAEAVEIVERLKSAGFSGDEIAKVAKNASLMK